jgi:hypothetical protein
MFWRACEMVKAMDDDSEFLKQVRMRSSMVVTKVNFLLISRNTKVIRN